MFFCSLAKSHPADTGRSPTPRHSLEMFSNNPVQSFPLSNGIADRRNLCGMDEVHLAAKDLSQNDTMIRAVAVMVGRRCACPTLQITDLILDRF